MNSSQKKTLKTILFSLSAYILAEITGRFMTFDNSNILAIGLFLVSYIVVGYGPIKSAFTNITRGQLFDENFLMTVATIGALCLKQWDEAVAVMMFYAIGNLFEDYAVNKSRNSISDLMNIYPEYANLLTENGEEQVDPYDLNIGDYILVKPGEKIPIDGKVVSGSASIDTSALTGEAIPVDVSAGDEITSGCINLNGVITASVSTVFEESTVSKILDLVENSGAKKAKVEKFITKFAKYYTPAVVFAAVTLALLPPLITGQPFGKWIYRALLFLVISCPCALVISVPLAFFGGVGAASKIGVLVKGSNHLEVLAEAGTFVMDKTGTLTTGNFKVTEASSDSALEILSLCEIYSSHPISLSIIDAYVDKFNKQPSKNRTTLIKEFPGKGLSAKVDDKVYYAGNARLMKEIGTMGYPTSGDKTMVYLADENKFLGFVALEDTLKYDSKTAIKKLTDDYLSRIILLTGDKNDIAKKIADSVNITEYYGELLPQDKVNIFENILSEEERPVVFVGDGINDAPTLARADVGIAMGGLGSQAAIEAADIVIMDDSLEKIPKTMKISGNTIKIAKENVIFALSIKALVLILGTFGFANMWMAVFADVGVSIIAILNSMRMIIKK